MPVLAVRACILRLKTPVLGRIYRRHLTPAARGVRGRFRVSQHGPPAWRSATPAFLEVPVPWLVLHPRPRPHWHKAFLAMLPQILTHAKCRLRPPQARGQGRSRSRGRCQRLPGLRPTCRAQGKTDIAYPIALARYGVKQTRDHRKVGGHLNIKDVLSRYCQVKKNVVVERLDQFDKNEEAWQDILISDGRCTPAGLAASRIDFDTWLKSLPAPSPHRPVSFAGQSD